MKGLVHGLKADEGEMKEQELKGGYATSGNPVKVCRLCVNTGGEQCD